MANLARMARNRVLANFPQAVVSERFSNGIKFEVEPGRFGYSTRANSPPYHLEDNSEVDTDWIPGDGSPYDWQMIQSIYHAFYSGDPFDSGNLFRYQNRTTGDFLDWIPSPNIQWTNDLNQIENVGLAKQSVLPTLGADDLYFSGAYGTGIDYKLLLDIVGIKKYLIVDSLATLGTAPQFIIDGGNPVLMFSIQFRRSPGVSIWVNGQEWGEGNGQANAVETSDWVEFRNSGNQVLFAIQEAIAKDSEGEVVNVLTRIRRSANNYFIEFRLDYDWIQQTAVFPIFIDPNINPLVASSTDDATETYTSGGQVITNGSADSIRASSSDYRLGGFRFQVNSVGQGQEMDVAWWEGEFSPAARDDIHADIAADDVDSAPTFTTTTNDISNRTQTTAKVEWQETGTGAARYQSPSLVSVFDEIFARGSWGAGNYVALIFDPQAYTTGEFTFVTSYDTTTTGCSEIYLEWTEGATTYDLQVTQDLGVSQTVSPGRIGELTVTHLVELLQTVSPGRIGELEVAQTVHLIQSVSPEILLDLALNQNLGISQAVSPETLAELQISLNLLLSQTVSPGRIGELTINQLLGIAQTVDLERIGELTINQVVHLLQSVSPQIVVSGVYDLILNQSVHLLQSVSPEIIREAIINHNLGLTQTVSPDAIVDLFISQNAKITQFAVLETLDIFELIVNQIVHLAQVVSPATGEVTTPTENIWLIPKEIRIWYIEEEQSYIIENEKRVWII